MMKVRIFFIILTFLLMASCDLITETVQPVHVTKVDSVKVNSITGTLVQFTVYATLFNGCSEFSHYQEMFQDNDIYIVLYHRIVSSGPCPQALVSIEVPVTVDVKKPGIYSFHFGPKDKAMVDLELSVP